MFVRRVQVFGPASDTWNDTPTSCLSIGIQDYALRGGYAIELWSKAPSFGQWSVFATVSGVRVTGHPSAGSAARGGLLRGRAARAALHWCFEQKADLVVLSGDITDSGREEEWQVLHGLLAGADRSRPTPGHSRESRPHDHPGDLPGDRLAARPGPREAVPLLCPTRPRPPLASRGRVSRRSVGLAPRDAPALRGLRARLRSDASAPRDPAGAMERPRGAAPADHALGRPRHLPAASRSEGIRPAGDRPGRAGGRGRARPRHVVADGGPAAVPGPPGARVSDHPVRGCTLRGRRAELEYHPGPLDRRRRDRNARPGPARPSGRLAAGQVGEVRDPGAASPSRVSALADTARLRGILSSHARVVVFHGHKHVGYWADLERIRVISAPSVAYGNRVGPHNCHVYAVDPEGQVSLVASTQISASPRAG